MKTYTSLLLVVAGLVVVVLGGYIYMKKRAPVTEMKASAFQMKTISGQVTRSFEGENTLTYSFDIPENATSAIGMSDALVRITENGALYAAVYMSYEGGRGYVPEEYINRIIAPQVHVLTAGGTSTVGLYTWTEAESANSEWHVAQVNEGKWLVVVENPKSNHDRVLESLGTMRIE